MSNKGLAKFGKIPSGNLKWITFIKQLFKVTQTVYEFPVEVINLAKKEVKIEIDLIGDNPKVEPLSTSSLFLPEKGANYSLRLRVFGNLTGKKATDNPFSSNLTLFLTAFEPQESSLWEIILIIPLLIKSLTSFPERIDQDKKTTSVTFTTKKA